MNVRLLSRLLADARAEGAVIAHPVAGGSLGPSPGVCWLTVLIIAPDPRDALDALYRLHGAARPLARSAWHAQHDPAHLHTWALLETHLTFPGPATIERWLLIPFNDPHGAHRQLLADTLHAHWLILLDCDDANAFAAFDHADLKGLQTARRLELANPDSRSVRIILRSEPARSNAQLPPCGRPGEPAP